MNELAEFFRGMFSTAAWPARWNCGYWSDFHGWLYIISDILIWVAYFLIPLIILNYLSKKKAALKFNQAYVYFAAFILLCGSTHFLDAMMFWVPMYRLNALVRLATAFVSLATVYHLVKILPEAFQQKTSVELEKEIHRRSEAEKRLEQTNRMLEESNKNLEAFAYMASHDLQEPLRKIRVFGSLLNEYNADVFDEKSKTLIEKMDSSANKMQTMINDVLALSALSENVSFSNVKLNEAVQNAMDDLEIKILEKNAKIELSELPAAKGNITYLSQLFMNLISNSLKFSTQTPVIRIKGHTRDGFAIVEVEDNGIGIGEDADKIFQPFYRMHARSDFEGTGIGLTICKKIVDIHKGNIMVDSQPGKGSLFTIKLPVGN